MDSRNQYRRFFEEEVHAHYEYLCKFLRTVTNDHLLVRDIAQETMATAWEKIHRIREYSNIKHALLSTAKNKLYDYYKKNRPNERVVPIPEICCDIPFLEEDGLKRLLRNEERRTVLAAIALLAAEYKRVILLRYYYGQSLRDVAKITNSNYNTIVSRHRRALKVLEKLLRKGE